MDWLLIDDEKNKVGRPKLADEKLLRRSRIMFISAIIVVVTLAFLLGCYLKNEPPLTVLYKITIGKILGPINNKEGFIINDYYNADKDYVMNVKITSKLKRYSASYKYTTYYLKNNKWIKYDSNVYDNETNNFKIVFKSKKNKNIIWKVKLQLVNANKIIDTYKPYDWSFKSSQQAEYNYAYKVFTVKGYYSPVPLEEIKESEKSNGDKVFVYTDKNTPRKLEINAPCKFISKVKYNDALAKEDYVFKKDSKDGKAIFNIPDMNVVSSVHVYVWVDNYSKEELEKVKLTNWVIKKDSNGNYYLTQTYLLIPSKAYKN